MGSYAHWHKNQNNQSYKAGHSLMLKEANAHKKQ